MLNILPDDSLTFPCGREMVNRFLLAPMTNTQSHEDGTLSDDELHWLEMRAMGGFGMTMTCASHVQKNGKGFPGQLGIWSDKHKAGHKYLAEAIKKHDSLAIIQLHHAGMRSPKNLIDGKPVSASTLAKYDCISLTIDEVHTLKNDFIEAAMRAKACGYDGVEIHGAHGYIICQFISNKYNLRDDEYGGSLQNRARLLYEIVEGIRDSCGATFIIGVRLSPERFGMDINEVKTICRKLIEDEYIDFLDISLWDCFKEPHEEKYKGKSLLDHFAELNYKSVKLTVAGKIESGKDVYAVLAKGVDFVGIGKAAILHHDFPKRVMTDKNFEPISKPVTASYLKSEGLGPDFIQYMRRWEGFVK